VPGTWKTAKEQLEALGGVKSADDLYAFTNSEHPDVRRAAFKHRLIGAEHIKTGISSEHPDVRKLAVNHPSIYKLIVQMGREENWPKALPPLLDIAGELLKRVGDEPHQGIRNSMMMRLEQIHSATGKVAESKRIQLWESWARLADIRRQMAEILARESKSYKP